MSLNVPSDSDAKAMQDSLRYSIWSHGRKLLFDNPLVVILITAFFLSGIYYPVIISPDNLLNILVQASSIGLIALGMLIVMIVGRIDLSVGAVAALSGVVLARCTEANLPESVGLVVALLSSALCGTLVGKSVVTFHVPSFIASLGVMGIARGAALIISDAHPIPVEGHITETLGGGSFLGTSSVVILLGICSIGLHGFLRRTIGGLRMYAIGSNEWAAWIFGIPAGRYVILSHVACGFFAGLAGIVLAGRLASAQPLGGNLYELDAITAVVVGGGALTGGRGSVPGTLLGVILLSSVRNAMVIMDISPYYHPIVLGMILIMALILDDIRSRRAR